MYQVSSLKLYNYLEVNGILLCNSNPYLPSLFDIGCTWSDVIKLIDSHEIFYCKVYRKRTTYLSKSIYFHMKKIYNRKTLSNNANSLYHLFQNSPPISTRDLKEISSLSKKDYTNAFNELLESMYITALHNDKTMNQNWSSFLYGTSEQWEDLTSSYIIDEDINSLDYIISTLSKTMSDKEINKLINLSIL